MKLLYITNGITGVGGLERVLSIKASYLADNYGYEVHILTLNEQDMQPFYIFSPQIVLHSIPYTRIFLYLSGLRKAVKEISPDIISVCDDGLKGFFVPRIIKNIPIIYERHASILLNTSDSLKGKIIKYLMNSQIKYFEKFVVLTKSNCKEWNKKNVVVIPNPLSFYPEKSNPLTQKKIIVVGSHSHNKGYDLLLQAEKKVSNLFPNWELHVYGKADTDKKIIMMAEQMNLSKYIHFHEPVKNIQEKYLNSSIMVLSSRSEGFGMVLIEAMACGLPCVSFDCPQGPSDIITDGEDGFLVSVGNVDKLAEKICFLIENEEERKRMGRNAKENVKRFLPENIMEKWNNLFRLLNKNA